jgi:hypothetical protein
LQDLALTSNAVPHERCRWKTFESLGSSVSMMCAAAHDDASCAPCGRKSV